MPIPAYMTIEGENQGHITEGCLTEDSVGNSFIEGHEDEFLVQAFTQEITIPRDPQHGQPTGHRVHGPITVTKVFDKSSPLLAQAMCSGERLSTCEIKWYRTDNTGTQEHYYTIELEDAVIVGIKTWMPNCLDPAQKHLTHMEDISISYRSITWTHEVAGTEANDDWRTARE